MLEQDIVKVISGTSIDRIHQDPEQPVKPEIRKVAVRQIIKLLEEKSFREVRADFV